MRVGVLQFDVVHGRPAENVDAIATALTHVDADLVVLPELCTTGYLHPSRQSLMALAEPADGPSATRLGALAVEKQLTLVAGIAELADGCVYNSVLTMTADGRRFVTRKRHLSRLETRVFDRGGPATPVAIDDAVLGAMICFDAWLPERARLLTRAGAEILCVPANFGGPDSLDVLRVRALENRVFVVVANRIGHESLDGVDAEFRGESRVIDPAGAVLADAGTGPGLVVTEIDVRAARDKQSVMTSDLAEEWATYSIAERD